MNPIDWWHGIKELEMGMQADAPSSELHALRVELERAGSVLVQTDNPLLGEALLRDELDPGPLLKTLSRSVSLTYQDPNATNLCREISDMKIQLNTYVTQLIGATGWTLGESPWNMQWLYHALEYPGLVAAYPQWFETVVQQHDWAWGPTFAEQFYMTSDSPCRDFLYDPRQKPWEASGVVEKMIGWLYYKEQSAPEKAALAALAWPEWMAHVRDYTQLHYQIAGAPELSWNAESVWATQYFRKLAERTVDQWKTTLSESWDCSGLLAAEP